MDYDGWYGRDNVFRHMVDVQFVAAMGPPGGGRTFVSNRYTRHFNNLGLANVRGRGRGQAVALLHLLRRPFTHCPQPPSLKDLIPPQPPSLPSFPPPCPFPLPPGL